MSINIFQQLFHFRPAHEIASARKAVLKNLFHLVTFLLAVKPASLLLAIKAMPFRFLPLRGNAAVNQCFFSGATHGH
ncbi:MAG TPA: hypothetical protein VMR99_02030 [Candidatus Paceibacterota bacterium]|nr:hypothetical protein [Candidatus Paceibacterota bacterium]